MAQICSFAFYFACGPTSASRNRGGGATCGLQAIFAFVLVILFFPTYAATQTLSGTVKNATSGKPSAGDEVELLNLVQGMQEVGRTRTDTNGNFYFRVDVKHNPYLVRALHEGVIYHRIARPGTASVALEVYDVARKVDGIVVFADIMRIEAARGQIVVTREFGVQNASTPPLTQMNERSLEFYIPDSAHIIDASATSQNGFPLKSAPVPEGDKSRYSFNFPLRPGLTRFAVTYGLPYSGSANLDPKSLYRLEHFMIMLPKSMQFKAMSSSTGFKLIHFPNQPNVTIHVAEDTTDHENLAFHISGEGMLTTGQQKNPQSSGEQEQSSNGEATGGQTTDRPGGGLGPPIDAPDPLQKHRWWILGGFAALLIIGGAYVARRQQSTSHALRYPKANSPLMPATQTGIDLSGQARIGLAVRARSTGLMEGIREELSQIEMEHRSGQISQAEYQKAKVALNRTLERVLKRQVQEA